MMGRAYCANVRTTEGQGGDGDAHVSHPGVLLVHRVCCEEVGVHSLDVATPGLRKHHLQRREALPIAFEGEELVDVPFVRP